MNCNSSVLVRYLTLFVIEWLHIMRSMTLCHLSVGQKPFSYLLTKGSNVTFYLNQTRATSCGECERWAWSHSLSSSVWRALPPCPNMASGRLASQDARRRLAWQWGHFCHRSALRSPVPNREQRFTLHVKISGCAVSTCSTLPLREGLHYW